MWDNMYMGHQRMVGQKNWSLVSWNGGIINPELGYYHDLSKNLELGYKLVEI